MNMVVKTVIITAAITAIVQIQGWCADYYVSPNGGGMRDGSQGNEFTLADAKNFARLHTNGMITFLLRSGNYGSLVFAEERQRNTWEHKETWKALPGQVPVFTEISLNELGDMATNTKNLTDCILFPINRP